MWLSAGAAEEFHGGREILSIPSRATLRDRGTSDVVHRRAEKKLLVFPAFCAFCENFLSFFVVFTRSKTLKFSRF